MECRSEKGRRVCFDWAAGNIRLLDMMLTFRMDPPYLPEAYSSLYISTCKELEN